MSMPEGAVRTHSKRPTPRRARKRSTAKRVSTDRSPSFAKGGPALYTSPMEELEAFKKRSGLLVHQLLAHSYFIYLAAVVVGFGLRLIWPLSFSFPHYQETGALLIVLGTVLT